MKLAILGLHHVTATVGDAQADLDFYRAALGLRLVKKTVNFDNHNVYHFYYGDERGNPGTIWTTFPYKGWGVPRGRQGQGQITTTAFSVPAGSLGYWTARLKERGFVARQTTRSDGLQVISFSDPSGLGIELIEESADERAPWLGNGIEPTAAIRGLHHVRLTLGAPDPTVTLMTGLFGFQVVGQHDTVIRLAVNGDLPGRRVELVHGTSALPARNGVGTVHHVAFAVASSEEQIRFREELLRLGFAVTEILDRQYFQSIYFREPGGVLFELATVRPGFMVDEALPQLGCGLMLPPWEETNRAMIEQRLPAVEA